MKPDTIYRLSEITVNADELRRIKDALDEQLAEGLALYRRVENLINQGTITKHATTQKETGNTGRDSAQEAIEERVRRGEFSGLHG